MSDVIQCPTCVHLAGNDPMDSPLAMDADTTNWLCQQGHSFTTSQIGALVSAIPEPEPEPRIDRRRKEYRNQKAAQLSQKLDEPEAENPDPKVSPEVHLRIDRVVTQGGDTGDTVNVFEKAFFCGDPEQPYGKMYWSKDSANPMKNGNLGVVVEVAEVYVETVLQLAQENRQTPQEWLQERLDFYLENEFSAIRRG